MKLEGAHEIATFGFKRTGGPTPHRLAEDPALNPATQKNRPGFFLLISLSSAEVRIHFFCCQLR